MKLRDSSVVKFGSQVAGRSIHRLAWAGVAGDASDWESREKEVAVGLKSGIVEIWNAQTRELTAQFDAMSMSAAMQSAVTAATTAIHPSTRAPPTVNAGSKLVGMAILQASTVGTGEYERRLLACTNTGLVHIRPFSTLAPEGDSTKMEDVPAPVQAKKGGKKSPSLQPAASPNMPNAGAASFAVGSDICVLKVEPSSQQSFACGGKEHMLKLWDITTATMTFKEKNVPHDMLNLRQGVWITDLAWVPGSGGHELVTGTAWHQVRHYDIRLKKRPTFNIEVGDHAVTCVDVSHDGRYLIVGDGGGRLQQLDLRKNARMVHVYHGMGGSVRGVQSHDSLPMLGACGLDRFLRVYDVNTRKQLHKVYLKQKLNCILFSAQTPDEEKEQEEAAAIVEASVKAEEEDDDELWTELRKRALRQKATAEGEPEGTGSGKYVKKRKQEDDAPITADDDEDDDDVQVREEPKAKKVKQEPAESTSTFAAAAAAPSAPVPPAKKKSALLAKVTSAKKPAAAAPVEVASDDDDDQDDDAMEDVEDGAEDDADADEQDGSADAEEAADEVPEVPATPVRKGRASKAPSAATPASASRATRSSTRTSTRSAAKKA